MLRIRKALADHFEQHGKGSLLPLLPYFTANVAAIDTKATTRLTYAAVAMSLFLLLDRSVVQSFSILGINFNNIQNIKIFFPPIVMYLSFAAIGAQLSRRLQEEIVSYVVSHEYEELSASNIDRYVVQPHLIQTLGMLADETKGVPNSIGDFMSIAIGAILILAVPIFYIYSFYILFRNFGVDDGLVWLSFAFSTILILYFGLTLWIFDRATSESKDEE